jgi:phosphoribosyl-ATP pyrophosphohydrolase/phosphoribosyl-AMP cyclohydrolase
VRFDGLKLDDNGLIPAIVQDADDGRVLMVAYMNAEAFAATESTGQVHFYSRSRQALWRKGETSGNTLALVALGADCDGDALLVRARPAGPTCHTGARSCFGDLAEVTLAPSGGLTLAPLLEVLRHRKADRPEGSYTVKLLDNPDKALRKLVEEATEVVLAVKNNDRANLVWEVADVLYHLAVVMTAYDIEAAEVNAELERRAGGGR